VSQPGTLAWFARPGFRLAVRDWLSIVTAGGHTKVRPVAIALLVFAAVMHLIAPRRTRLVAQIVAAVIGAAFVIGLQLAAIASNGTLSRYAVLASSRSSP
jgi:ABC-2 type transport system permease protein